MIYNRFEVEKVLIVAPLRVAETTWSEENEKWEHLKLKIVKVLGSEKERIAALNETADVYVINRENVKWLIERYEREFQYEMVVLDESSSFKNPQSERFRAMRRVRPYIKRIVELTGTPAPNSLMDLWSQIYLLDGGERLGRTQGEYRRKYFTAGATSGHIVYNWNVRKGAEKEIYEKIKEISVSMKSEDYIKLPPVMHNFIKVKLPKETEKKYKKFEREKVLEMKDGEITATTAGVLANKLLQFANGAMYNEEGEIKEIHAEKIEALKELRETAESPMLIFYWYRHDLERLEKAFPEAVKLRTTEEIKEWNEGKIKMLMAHPASAGHGLNLQYGGNIIVWFSMTWSLEYYKQANKRLHRSGQSKPVMIHHLIAEGTIDETVIKVLTAKNVSQENLLNALKARISEVRK